MNLAKINPVFQHFETDHLYHLGIDSSMDLKTLFSGIKYVILSRFNEDVSVLVHEFAKQWYQIDEDSFEFKPLFKTERYHLYKIGPILSVSHGVGAQSMLICLNEITKLLVHAEADEVTFLKVGPSGGIDLEPGEIVVSNAVMNHQFEQTMSTIACGEEYVYPTYLDLNLVDDIIEFSRNLSGITIHVGATMNTSDYYEGQARLNGFLPLPYSTEERDAYLNKAKIAGIKSIDMESLYFAGFCNQLDIRAGIINTIIVNRLISDDVMVCKHEQLESQRNTAKFLASYIIDKLEQYEN